MRKLTLVPSQAGYGVGLGNEVLVAQLSGGPSRTRSDFLGAVASASVSWTLGPDAFDYLQAFYRTATRNAAEPFLLDMVLDGALLREYQVKFVPGSYQIVGVQGLTTTVQASLEVRPAPVDHADDEALLDLFEDYGDELDDTLFGIAELVNVTMPSAIPG